MFDLLREGIMVRAKFRVNRKEENEQGWTVELWPVSTNDPEHPNFSFYKYTPAGKIELTTINPEAANEFEVGQEYFVDFTKDE